LTEGDIHETKVQVKSEGSLRKLTELLDAKKKNYFTYQLKSSKGQKVVIKGIEPDVSTAEVEQALKDKGFNVKTVSNKKWSLYLTQRCSRKTKSIPSTISSFYCIAESRLKSRINAMAQSSAQIARNTDKSSLTAHSALYASLAEGCIPLLSVN